MDIEQVSGEWWVLKGQDCGQEGWASGYDWYPCQHERIIPDGNGGWINNVTYCAGSDSTCHSDYIVTTPIATLTSPGVVTMDYPQGEAPVVPQTEDWKIVSYPDPDWAFIIWCGSNPAMDYNGAFVMSRHRSLDALPVDIEAEFRDVASRFGMDYDLMCISDNTNCEV